MVNKHKIHSIQIPKDTIDRLLDDFEECINSKRTQSRITTIAELIEVLWNRNIFCTDQNTLNLTKYFANHEQRHIVNSFINSLGIQPTSNPQNIYAKLRQENASSGASKKSTESSINDQCSAEANQKENPELNHRRHETFKIVCDEIDNWRDLGRCFYFKDVELVRISSDQELRNDIKLIVYRLLEQAETKFGDQFYHKLKKALDAHGRKDILRTLKKSDLI